MGRALIPAACALALAGCSTFDANIDDLVGIEFGVYGQVTIGCDTPGCSVRYLPAGRRVGVFDQDPIANPEALPTAVALVGSRGFYEVALDAGDHWLLVDTDDALPIGRFTRTQPVTLEPDTLVRWDWRSGPGGDEWTR